MEVYVLTHDMDYEVGRLVGVYADLDKARQYVEDANREDLEEVRDGVWMTGGYDYYTIRRVQVK